MKLGAPRVGDVFSVNIDDANLGVGQVVAKYGKDAYYFAIFDQRVAAGEQRLEDLVDDSRVLFLALSLDAKIHVGDWKIIGNATVSQRVKLPAYKEALGNSGEFQVVDWSGKRKRLASNAESKILPNRKIVAPIRLEKALRSKFGLLPWQENYTELAPSDIATTERLFAGC